MLVAKASIFITACAINICAGGLFFIKKSAWIKTKSARRWTAPLRVAGQSVTEELDDFLYDQVIAPLFIALFAVIYACLEWFRYFQNLKPNPIAYSAAAALAILYAVVKIWRSRKHVRRMKLGRDGERVVAQYLEWFRSANYFVFHDIPNGDANVDHVLVGPAGVFTIETKTLSKPRRGPCKITVAHSVVHANGKALDRDPIVQAKAQAGWLKSFLAESQMVAHIQPVVVFPGWFIEPFDMKAAGAWVLEPKALGKYVENEPVRLAREQVQAISSALRSHIRAHAKK